jgi:hypothetical protein
MRCQRNLPPWRFGGRDVYGAAKMIYSKRQRKIDLQVEEGSMWDETSPSSTT